MLASTATGRDRTRYSLASRSGSHIVTGFDSGAAMLKLARRRLGDDADLLLADLSRPLPFPDGAFDDVIVSLVLHYLKDWTAPLAELRCVLKAGGRLTYWHRPLPANDRRLHRRGLPDRRDQ
jgi:ubiquinone/menaquinone biosynthesis C-methylase UbiE